MNRRKTSDSLASITATRKDQHIEINLQEDVASTLSAGFEKIQFCHEALPDVDYRDIDTSIDFLGKKLQAPFLISGMTGGTERAKGLNERLARAANEFGLAMALGSMRVLLEDPSVLPTFNVRALMPALPLLANLGAVQLNEGVSTSDCQRLVDLVQADALILHLNPLQELLQPEGDKNWKGLLPKIQQLVKSLAVPVIVKEVGYGLSAKLATRLIEAGVAVLDVAGAGGTSWSQVEALREPESLNRRIAEGFRNWGISTVDSLYFVRSVSESLPLIASGGIRSGIDAAKAIHLSATLCGIAGPLLKAANLSEDALTDELTLFCEQLKITMMCTNSRMLMDLPRAELVSKPIF